MEQESNELKICPSCGVAYSNNNFYFSYRPDVPVNPNEVYTKVCRHRRDLSKECPNKIGSYDPKYDPFMI